MISLLVVIVVVGALVAIVYQLPIPAAFRNIALIVGVLFVLIYVLKAFGLWSGGLD